MRKVKVNGKWYKFRYTYQNDGSETIYVLDTNELDGEFGDEVHPSLVEETK